MDSPIFGVPPVISSFSMKIKLFEQTWGNIWLGPWVSPRAGIFLTRVYCIPYGPGAHQQIGFRGVRGKYRQIGGGGLFYNCMGGGGDSHTALQEAKGSSMCVLVVELLLSECNCIGL